MKTRRLLVLLGAGLAGMTALAVALTSREGAAGSALSRTEHGWLVARRYAEERGLSVRLLDNLDTPTARNEALIVVFPWQRFYVDDDGRFVRGHLLRGGTLILGYSGRVDDLAEQKLLGALQLERQTRGAPPPLHPLRWREHARAEWSLVPVEPQAAAARARVRAMRLVPELPPEAEVLRRNEEGLALVALVPRFGGRVLLLPAEALANARLTEEGNADLLETLAHISPQRWAFDEYHHGLTGATSTQSGHPERAFQLWIAHLALVYLLAVLALARRLGPAWSDPPVTSGSARSFFLGIGALHARLGHQREALAVLAARARELDPQLRLPRDPVRGIPDDDAFVRFAQAVARAQKRRT
jgi:hypothetical protein